MNAVQIGVGAAGVLLLLFRYRQQLLSLLPRRKPAASTAVPDAITREQAIGHVLQLQLYAELHQLTTVLDRIPELTADLVRSVPKSTTAPRATSKSK